MQNIPQKRLAAMLIAAALAAGVGLFYVVSQDREFLGGILKALFGLSGGNTAGG